MSRGKRLEQVGSFSALHTVSMMSLVCALPPKGPKYLAESFAVLFTSEKDGYSFATSSRMKG